MENSSGDGKDPRRETIRSRRLERYHARRQEVAAQRGVTDDHLSEIERTAKIPDKRLTKDAALRVAHIRSVFNALIKAVDERGSKFKVQGIPVADWETATASTCPIFDDKVWRPLLTYYVREHPKRPDGLPDLHINTFVAFARTCLTAYRRSRQIAIPTVERRMFMRLTLDLANTTKLRTERRCRDQLTVESVKSLMNAVAFATGRSASGSRSSPTSVSPVPPVFDLAPFCGRGGDRATSHDVLAWYGRT